MLECEAGKEGGYKTNTLAVHQTSESRDPDCGWLAVLGQGRPQSIQKQSMTLMLDLNECGLWENLGGGVWEGIKGYTLPLGKIFSGGMPRSCRESNTYEEGSQQWPQSIFGNLYLSLRIS